MEHGGEVGRDASWEVYIRAFAFVIEVYDDLGWVSDGVDEVSGDHFVQGGFGRSSIIDQCEAMSITPIKVLAGTGGLDG